LILALLLAACCAVSASASSQSDSEAQRLASAHSALDSQRWEEAARFAAGPPQQSAEFDLIAGLALARLDRWDQARFAFSSGRRKLPRDARFPMELAGVAYKQKRFAIAKRELHSALALDPADHYARDFLATIYFLEGNLEAALKYWNPLDKPRLKSVSVAPLPRVNADLLNSAINFHAPQILTSEALLAANARLDALGVFPRHRIEVAPAANSNTGSTAGLNNDPDAYNATLHLLEKNAFGDSWLESLVSTFSGLPYSTVYPEFLNAGRRAINFTSLARWDSQKRRFALTAASPLFGNASQHLELFFDARNENWNLSQTLFVPGAALFDLNVRTVTGGARLKFIPGGRWSWSAGIEAAVHSFRNVSLPSLPVSAQPFFTDSSSLAVSLAADRSLLRIPEHRFTLDASAELRAGRKFAAGLGGFGAARASLLAHWFPKAAGDNYETRLQLRTGAIAGPSTIDELFQLGAERDNDLWLRGHTGTSAGRKGAAPLGRRYLLANFEFDKTFFNAGFLKIKLGPLLDTGSIADSSALLGSRQWLVDVGAQCKIQVLTGITILLSYGHDLRGGHSLFYPTVLR